MPLPNGHFEIAEFLYRLAQNLTHQQLRLDQEYEKQLQEFRAMLLLAKDQGYEELARTLAPVQMILDKANLKLDLLFSESGEQQFSVGVKPLNLAFTRKYQYSQFVKSTLQFEVQTIPLPPGEESNPPLA
jgi:hypothetical protein